MLFIRFCRDSKVLLISEISSRRSRIVEHRSDNPFRIDNENRSDGLRIGGAWVNHAIFVGNIHTDICNQGNLTSSPLYLFHFNSSIRLNHAI